MTTTWTRGRDVEVKTKKVGKDAPEFWAPKIRTEHDRFEASLRSSLAVAIDLGKQILAAKEALPHGEFGRLFAGHENPVEGHLPFVRQWAQRVATMAGNPVIANVHHGGHLPADLNAVYELATMQAAELKSAIDDGKVTPQTTRAEAKAIKAEFAEPKPREKREDDGDRKEAEKAKRSERQVLEDCSQAIEEAIGTALLAYPSLRAAIAGRLRVIEENIRAAE